jgi:hypothetical protein
MHLLMPRSKKLIVLSAGLMFLLVLPSILAGISNGSLSFSRKGFEVDGGKSIPRGIPAGFDILQKAQKNIQHDLGLPETPSSSPSTGTSEPSTVVPVTHPYIAGTLLFIAITGLFALFFILYREIRKTRKKDLPETGISGQEWPMETPSGEILSFKDFPDVSSLVLSENHAAFPSYDLSRNIEKSGRELAEKLDGILAFVRKGLGRFQEDLRLALYHDDDPSGLPVLLSITSGKKYPDFYVTPQILERSKEKAFPRTQPRSMTASFLDGTRVETVSIPFYDGMGSRFILFISLAGEWEIPEKWKVAGQKLANDLRPLLESYARLHYLPVTSTRKENGDPDARAIENRMIEEMLKGKRLSSRASLLFIKIVSSSPFGQTSDVNVFFRLFRDRLEKALRASDRMISDDKGTFTILLPETMQGEAHAVLNRIMDVFEEEHKRYGRFGLRFLSDLREIRPEEDAHPESLLGRGSRLEVPPEGKVEPREYARFLISGD